jgi:hypothetical protein
MARRLLVLRVVVAIALAGSPAAACSTREGPAPSGTAEPSGQRPPEDAADLCEALGRESLDRLVPAGEPIAETADLGPGYTESTCSVHTPVDSSMGTRDLWVEVNRYPRTADASADENCRKEMRSSKLQHADSWQHGSAKDLPLDLGDVTEAQVRSMRYDAEAEILLCRSGRYVRIHYQADEVDQDEVADQAESLAREYLDTQPR